jgi:maltose O-acetyltransferase
MRTSEATKMKAGEVYDALDDEVISQRMKAHDLCHSLASIKPSDLDAQKVILHQLLPNAHEGFFITPPFFCDYGWNITSIFIATQAV